MSEREETPTELREEQENDVRIEEQPVDNKGGGQDHESGNDGEVDGDERADELEIRQVSVDQDAPVEESTRVAPDDPAIAGSEDEDDGRDASAELEQEAVRDRHKGNGEGKHPLEVDSARVEYGDRGEVEEGPNDDDPQRGKVADSEGQRRQPMEPKPVERRGGGGASGAVNLFVRNVAKHVTEQQLIDLFSQYGAVDSAVVVRDPHSQECRGFGFVKVKSDDDADKVIDILRNFDFEGRSISVERAKRSNPHERTPGAYMGVDRRIRDRYAGMKRSRDSDPPGYDYGGGRDSYGMASRGGQRGRFDGMGRGRYDERPWDSRVSRMNFRPDRDERDRFRRRLSHDNRHNEAYDRYRDREPPVPREPADDYV